MLGRVSPGFGNGSACTQAVDVGRTKSQLTQNLLIVLPELGSALGGDLRDAMHLNRARDRRRQLAAGAVERNDDVVWPQLRIIDDLLRAAHRTEGDVNAAEDLVPMRHWLCAEHL